MVTCTPRIGWVSVVFVGAGVGWAGAGGAVVVGGGGVGGVGGVDCGGAVGEVEVVVCRVGPALCGGGAGWAAGWAAGGGGVDGFVVACAFAADVVGEGGLREAVPAADVVGPDGAGCGGA